MIDIFNRAQVNKMKASFEVEKRIESYEDLRLHPNFESKFNEYLFSPKAVIILNSIFKTSSGLLNKQ